MIPRQAASFLFAILLLCCEAFSTRPISREGKSTTLARAHSVGIVGAGAVALGTAALLNNNAMLWSPSGRSLSPDFQSEGGGGALPNFQCRIASSVEELVTENDVVLLALPANGHKRVFDSIAPFLEQNRHHVIISSHASMGALYLFNLCRQFYDTEIPVTAWGTTVLTARQPSPQKVRINTVRKFVDVCTIPNSANDEGTNLCRSLFPGIQFCPRSNLLAITLSNLNPQNHLGIALGNISRMDKGEQWYQSENITPRIGKLLEDLDRERLEIAMALDLSVKTIFEHFSWSFHVPITESISDMNQQIHLAGNDVFGPNTAESRYVTEDVPFGLPMTVVLGELVGRPATLHKSGLAIMSSMYGRDFEAENDLLRSLRLEEYTLEQLQEASVSGHLPSFGKSFQWLVNT